MERHILDAPGTRIVLAAAAYLAVFYAGLHYAYLEVFSRLSPHDDEGTIIQYLRLYLDDTASFDQINYFFGPFFYLVEYVTYKLSGVEVSHDFNRLKTMVYWGLIALTCGYYVQRLTRSVALGLVVQMQLIIHLNALAGSSGHPQGLSLLLIALTLLCSSLVGKSRLHRAGLVGLGAGTVALALVKINLGVYLIVPLALAVLLSLPGSKAQRCLVTLSAAAAMSMPLAVMWRHALSPSPEQNYAIAVTLVLAACLTVLVRERTTTGLLWRDARWILYSATATALLTCGTIIALGAAPASVLDATLLRPLAMAGDWHVPTKVNPSLVIAGLISFLLAGVYILVTRQAAAAIRTPLSALKVLYGSVSLYCMLLQPSGALYFWIPLPFAWLLLVQTVDTGSSSGIFARRFLCLAAVFQSLQAYPVAGAQGAWSGMLLVPLAAICISDGVRGLLARRSNTASASGVVAHQGWKSRGITCALLLVASITYFMEADIATRKQKYAEHTPLHYPGAQRIRLPREQTEEINKLVSIIEANCDMFLGLPGFPSLYFWTDVPAPAPLSSDWVTQFPKERHAGVIQRMEDAGRPCFIRNLSVLNFWTQHKRSHKNTPLALYAESRFRPVAHVGNYQVLLKQGQWLVSPHPGMQGKSDLD